MAEKAAELIQRLLHLGVAPVPGPVPGQPELFEVVATFWRCWSVRTGGCVWRDGVRTAP